MANSPTDICTVSLEVPMKDTEILARAAKVLRTDEPLANTLRRVLTIEPGQPGSGAEIIEAFRKSPLLGETIEALRHEQNGRQIEIE